MEKTNGEENGAKKPRQWSGKQLDSLLLALSKAVEIILENQEAQESQENSKKSCLAKALKPHLCVGINNVTRTLERMPVAKEASEPKRLKTANNIVTELNEQQSKRASRTTLQAVIVAADVKPRSLVAHLDSLCASRGVVMLSINGGDGSGSLKLGELFGTRTAIAVGIKEGDTPINWALESILEKR